jgi:hypothetical protein
MSLTVVFRETALRGMARIRSEDKDLFVRTRRAITLLAEQPHPGTAVAWGATVDDEAAAIYIINVAAIS